MLGLCWGRTSIQLRMRANPPPRILWQHSFLKTLSLPLQIRHVMESCRKFSISKWLRVLSQMVVQEGRKGFKNEAKWSHLGSTLELGTPCGPDAPKGLNARNVGPPPGPQNPYFSYFLVTFFTALFHLFFLHFWSPFLGIFRHHFWSILEPFFIPFLHVAKRADPSKTLPLPAK